MITSSSRVRNFERGFFGPIRTSDENLRAFHLAIVLRSTPYRLARTVFFSSLAWIASRTLGVVVIVLVPLAFPPDRPRKTALMRQRTHAFQRAHGSAEPARRRPRDHLLCESYAS